MKKRAVLLLAPVAVATACSLGAAPGRFLATDPDETDAASADAVAFEGGEASAGEGGAGSSVYLIGGEEPAPPPSLRRATATTLFATWRGAYLAPFTPGFALPEPGIYGPVDAADGWAFVGAASVRDDVATIAEPKGPLVLVRAPRGGLEGWTVGTGPVVPIARGALTTAGSFVFVVASSSTFVASVDAKALTASAFRDLRRPLASAREVPSTCFVGNELYVVGGETPPDNPSAAVDHATLDPAAGALGPFAAQPPLATGTVGATCIGARGRLYVLGGRSGAIVDTVLSAAIGAGGTLGPWRTEPSLPTPLLGGTVVMIGDELVVLGGVKSGDVLSDRVFAAKLDGAGAPTWRTVDRALARPMAFARAISF